MRLSDRLNCYTTVTSEEKQEKIARELDTDFGSTLDFLGAINCVYVVYAANCEMYRSRVFSEALREFRKWTLQLNAALPSMGDSVKLEVLL